jgi:hypothetical protein
MVYFAFNPSIVFKKISTAAFGHAVCSITFHESLYRRSLPGCDLDHHVSVSQATDAGRKQVYSVGVIELNESYEVAGRSAKP